jgi:hypothetical protein
MNRIGIAASVAVLFGLLAGCTAQTAVRGAQSDGTYAGESIGRTMVMGVSPNPVNRRLFESQFAQALRDRGYQAVAAWSVLPKRPKDEYTREELKRNLFKGNFDAILITRLVKQEQQSRVVSGAGPVHPTWYEGMYGYYHRSYAITRAPSYVEEKSVYELETNLYKVEGEALLWSTRSETVDPKSLEDGVKSFSQTMSRRLAATFAPAP